MREGDDNSDSEGHASGAGASAQAKHLCYRALFLVSAASQTVSDEFFEFQKFANSAKSGLESDTRAQIILKTAVTNRISGELS